jgi:hypothetical protein
MRARRFVFFLLAIGLGLGLMLLYAWVLAPARFTQSNPSALRSDFKADVVLMTAEIYHSDHDLGAAQQRLGFLGGASPLLTAQNAVLEAQKLGYTRQDVELLGELTQALQSTPGGTQ